MSPARRTQRRLLLVAVSLMLLIGVAVGLFQRSRRQTSLPSNGVTNARANRSAAPTPPEKPEIEAPAPNADPPVAAAPPVVDPRYVPPNARLLCSLNLADSPAQTAAQGWFELLTPVWSAALEPLQSNPALAGNQLARFTWIALDPSGWGYPGVAIIEYRDPLPAGQPPVAEATALDWQLAGATVYSLAGKAPQLFATIGPRTVLTGPENIVAALAGRGSVPAPSPPQDDAAQPLPDAAPDATSEVTTEDPQPADAPVANAATAPEEDAKGEANIATAPVAETPPTLPVPAAHDVAVVIDFAEDPTGVPAWISAVFNPTGDSDPAWQPLRQASLFVDIVADAALVELGLTCATEAEAAKIESALADRLTTLQKRYTQLLEQESKAAPQVAPADAAASPIAVVEQLLRTATVTRDDSKILIRGNTAPRLGELGQVVLFDTPAIEAVRQPAALAFGEPRIAHFTKSLMTGAEADQSFPAAAAGSSILPPETRLSWIATLLPYFGQPEWRQKLNLARSWQDAENTPITHRPLPAAINPLFGPGKTPAGFPVTHYVGVSGVGADAATLPAEDPRAGVFGNQPRRVADVQDGLSNTIAVMGVREEWGPWSAGGPATVRSLTRQPYVNGPDGFGTGQADGMLVGLADGSARFVSSQVDPRVLEQLSTINGKEADALAALGPVTPPNIEPAAPPAPAETPAVPARPDEQPGETPPPKRAGGLRAIDLAARLQDPIRAMKVDRLPLSKFLNLLNDLTTLAISIDVDSIGGSSATGLPISINAENGSVQKLIEQALSEHKLVLVIEGDQLVVRAGDIQAPARRDSYDVSDLLSGPPDKTATGEAAPLAVLVRQLIAPGTWTNDGGAGTAALDGNKLVVDQPPRVQRQVIDLLDRIRTARGKTKVPPAEVQARLASPWTAIERELELPLSVNFLDDTPLVSILAYLSEKTNIEFIVDWRALRAVEIGPDVQSGLHIQNQSLDKTLTALLAPLGLDFRPLDGQTIQISTPSAIESSSTIAFYPVRQLVASTEQAKTLLKRLKTEVDPPRWEGENPAAVAIVDHASRYLIVRGNPTLQRQVGQAIQQWRAAAAKPKS